MAQSATRRTSFAPTARSAGSATFAMTETGKEISGRVGTLFRVFDLAEGDKEKEAAPRLRCIHHGSGCRAAATRARWLRARRERACHNQRREELRSRRLPAARAALPLQ